MEMVSRIPIRQPLQLDICAPLDRRSPPPFLACDIESPHDIPVVQSTFPQRENKCPSPLKERSKTDSQKLTCKSYLLWTREVRRRECIHKHSRRVREPMANQWSKYASSKPGYDDHMAYNLSAIDILINISTQSQLE